MHLSLLEISNFRSCRDTNVWLQPDLTVLVGENNSGKSNLIDAIRLATSPSDGRRSRYCELSDLSFASDLAHFEIRGVYGGLSHAEQAQFISASNGVGTGEIAYRLRFDAPEPHARRGRTSWTVGANDAIDPEPAARERIRHVYLPPLRDAQQVLASGSGERIEFVLHALAAGDELEALESSAADAFDGLGEDPLITRANDSIAARVTDLSRGSIPHVSQLGFVEPKLRQLARALRVKMGEAGLDPVDLSHSGLGYANLLFLATVVVELEATHDADLTLFLVEEPEAHLHPQLQTAVLDFLVAAARQGADGAADIQVVVTTHSAQLASALSASHVEVIKAATAVLADPAGEAAEEGEADDEEGAGEVEVRCTRSVPIWRLDVEDHHRRKVDRYLNATRSPMLFGPRVILVEGIAEALLLPSLAKRHLAEPDQLARFRGVALVPIDGVDFEPYLRLLLTPHEDLCIAERVIVITDLDPEAPGDRVAALLELAADLGADDRIVIEAAEITLEASLYSAGNEECLRAGFLAQRPQSQHIWDDLVALPPADQPAGLIEIFQEKRISKGDFAQHVAAKVESPDQFETPPYLLAAVMAAIA